ncbi:MAG TPA: hypothetical protein VFN62_11840, partial [Acidobacteriaceae bacterium]|nr:hypothetical protein [Acidobacteriaceae bacterium]
SDVSSGPVSIAIRMWMAPFTPLVDPDAGGLHGSPVLGQVAAVDELLKLDWDAEDRAIYLTFFEVAVLPLALLVAFGLFWLDRQEPAFLWLGITCACLLLERLFPLTADYIPTNAVAVFLIPDAILRPGIIGLWVVFWAYWFRLDRMFQIHRIAWGLAGLLGLGMAMLRAPLYGSVVPVHAIVWLSPLTLGLKLLLGLLLVWVVYRGIYKEKAEGWLALPAVVLVGLSIYQEELTVLHVPAQFFPFWGCSQHQSGRAHRLAHHHLGATGSPLSAFGARKGTVPAGNGAGTASTADVDSGGVAGCSGPYPGKRIPSHAPGRWRLFPDPRSSHR